MMADLILKAKAEVGARHDEYYRACERYFILKAQMESAENTRDMRLKDLLLAEENLVKAYNDHLSRLKQTEEGGTTQ